MPFRKLSDTTADNPGSPPDPNQAADPNAPVGQQIGNRPTYGVPPASGAADASFYVRRAYRGKSVFPIRKRSIDWAQRRPSRMAQTTSDWPRRMSPAENTFDSEVW
jgi:hypothetical protein